VSSNAAAKKHYGNQRAVTSSSHTCRNNKPEGTVCLFASTLSKRHTPCRTSNSGGNARCTHLITPDHLLQTQPAHTLDKATFNLWQQRQQQQQQQVNVADCKY
jgi:hypothetical protein